MNGRPSARSMIGMLMVLVSATLGVAGVVASARQTPGFGYDLAQAVSDFAGSTDAKGVDKQGVRVSDDVPSRHGPHSYDDRSNLARASARPGGYRLAPGATGGSQRIYRSVEPNELANLAGSGQYRNIPGIGDGKYFFPTKQQADAFGEMMAKRNIGGPYCTTSGCIPSNLLRQVDRITPAGEGPAYYVPESMLRYIDDIIIHGG